MEEKRIGIFGGSFDPPHEGHLKAANSFYDECGLAELYIVPAFAPPHKELSGRADANMRLHMCSLAFEARTHRNFFVSDDEIKRGGRSFTVDTVRKFRKKGKIFLFVGTDNFTTFEKWRGFEEIFSMCTLCVMPRDENTVEIKEKMRYYREKYKADIRFIDSLPEIMSSSDIRKRLANGDFSGLCPRVAEYIKSNCLYGCD